MQESQSSIRFAVESDIPDLLTLYSHLHENDIPPPDEESIQRTWESISTSNETDILVFELDKKLVSTCVVSIIPNFTRGCRPYALIENVVTHREYRRQGIGKRLMIHAQEFAFRNGCYKAMLLTGQKDLGVHEFYRSCGFSSGEKQAYVSKASQ